MSTQSRREFLTRTTGLAGTLAVGSPALLAQLAGERPPRAEGITVLNPRHRVPVGIIIDDSTCLVNLNRFAMPQFDTAYDGKNAVYHRNWREWPVEIPDGFVRKFGEWAAAEGVKGKWSVVPYPACVGRLDRLLPGWTARELAESLELVRTVMLPNWDLHPEMITHTRVLDTRTGQPYPEASLAFMENWDWSAGKSVDELTDYLGYALRILKNAGLPCEGVTTPGGFGNRARPELAQATLRSVREVFGAEIPHYFRDLHDSGTESVAPRVEYAGGLDGSDPRCVVSVLACTGDWTGGWDNSPPEGADKFITPDLQRGRMVEVIERGEPAFMLAHWTGVYWNGQELGFRIFQEVVRRLRARFDHLIWMKTGELARYWAARELTRIERSGSRITFRAPFPCPDFTVRLPASTTSAPRWRPNGPAEPLTGVRDARALGKGTWLREKENLVVCVDLPKGASTVEVS